MAPVLYTVGHASRSVTELAQLVQQHGVRVLVDVRSLPRSRSNPQHNREALSVELPAQYGLAYQWLGRELGGLRSRDKASELNAGWEDAAYRGEPGDAFWQSWLLHTLAIKENSAGITSSHVCPSRVCRLHADAGLCRGCVPAPAARRGRGPCCHHVRRDGEHGCMAGTPWSQSGQHLEMRHARPARNRNSMWALLQVYWQCHRALLSDALEARGVQVLHIIQGDKPPYPHKLTKFARIEGAWLAVGSLLLAVALGVAL